MTYQESIRSVLSKYVTFSGRASRSEYWWFTLFTIMVSVAIYLLGLPFSSNGDPALWTLLLQWGFNLAILLPTIALGVRRMHDIGKGGGWIFITLIPLIGFFWYIVLAATPGDPGDNRFGPMPR
ncbi:MAG: DUF805 domain-containing protein [Muribaculaceae bacterium]|nr:DUF805 domain-containing protein [Muribaculaceae bacterium]MDE6532624.1 DUF805 domain-containing protein [Muribaculaceae bacterium]